ncbi:MAG: TIGR02757 family protein [Bacteroidota bacterium]
MKSEELKSFLDEKVVLYNTPRFIKDDPILIPHEFNLKEDIEISGFLAATIAWGQRKTIIRNAKKILEIMEYSPHDFIVNHNSEERKKCMGFVHRTFNAQDLAFFLQSLQNIYLHHGGLQKTLRPLKNEHDYSQAISRFKQIFFELDHEKRTQKHVADPLKGSSAKRLNMFLRWMVRKDNCGVDLGIWKEGIPSKLSIPLDVHTGNVARILGLLERKQNDHKAVLELDRNLRQFDPEDPVKYDFALFGLGAYENFSLKS